MIFGTVEVGPGVLHTHNDSYALSPNTTLSVLRPFRVMGIGMAGLLAAFGWAFHDLLFPGEIAVIAGCSAVLIVAGNSIAHLVVVNRDLHQSDLSIAVWGTYRHLNRVRRAVADAINPAQRGSGS